MSERDVLNALHVPFDGVHFLINRNQCAASVFASDVHERAGAPAYYQEMIRLSGFELALFNLHAYIGDLFRVHTDAKAQLVLVLPLERLSPETRDALKRVTGGVDEEQFALRVSSETAMRSVEVDQLRPNGVVLERHLVQNGIIAVHPEAGSFGFLIDLDRIVSLSLGKSA